MANKERKLLKQMDEAFGISCKELSFNRSDLDEFDKRSN